MTPGERLAAAEADLVTFKKMCEDHETRLRLIEDKKNWMMGAIAVLVVVWPFISHKIGELLGLWDHTLPQKLNSVLRAIGM
jgi:hypothetical protein